MDILATSTLTWQKGWQVVGEHVLCLFCDDVMAEKNDPDGEEKIAAHLQTVHGGVANALIHATTKYNTLTAKQKELLTLFATEKSDQEIAQLLQISPSTVRHQKFTFREKAKQATLYQAIYASVFQKATAPTATLLSVPEKSFIVDDRFNLTEAEYGKILQQYFDFSGPHLTLTLLPKSQKKIIGILNRIVEEFSLGVPYSGTTIDSTLQKIYFDYSLLKRYLVDYGYFKRTADGATYQRIY